MTDRPPAAILGIRSRLADHRQFQWLFPLCLYVALVIPALWIHRLQINPDGICYLRLSTYLLHGDWRHSFSGYWSPLLPWCMTPLLAIGIDGLLAARITLAIIGGFQVVAAWRFLRGFPGIRPTLRLAMMTITALVAVRLSVKIITPDLLMATLLIPYLGRARHISATPRRDAFAAGLFAGFAYLAKAYAMPFFLAHFTVTMLLRRGTWATFGMGMAGFVVVALPWVALLSVSYGRPTMGTAGQFNHNNVDEAPPEARYRPGFFVPPSPYLIESEIKDRAMTESWNPLSSMDHLRRQARIARANVPRVAAALGSFDGIWLVPLAMLLALIETLRRQKSGEARWLAMTVAVYCSGFAFVYFEPRLIEAAMRFPALVLCVLTAGSMGQSTLAGRIAPCLVIGAFGVSSVIGLAGAFRSTDDATLFRDAAVAIRKEGLRGPIASNNRGVGAYVAYFLDAPLIGTPPSDTPDEFARDCRRVGARCLVFREELNAPIRSAIPGGWSRFASIPSPRARLDLYSHPGP